jgi:hypothetical protein
MEQSEKEYTMEEAGQLFDEWRKERKRRTPIPEELWKAAICLTRQHSIQKVSKYLHLSYNELKLRAGKSNGNVVSKTPAASRFIELDVLPATECTIEIEKPGGAKMKISIKGRSDLDLMEFGRAFWGNE